MESQRCVPPLSQCLNLSLRVLKRPYFVCSQADWKEGFKKKQAGVSDMTLLTSISNESINDNLKKRSVNLPDLQWNQVQRQETDLRLRLFSDSRMPRST